MLLRSVPIARLDAAGPSSTTGQSLDDSKRTSQVRIVTCREDVIPWRVERVIVSSMTADGSHSANAYQDRIERHTLDLLRTTPVEVARREGARALRASIPDADDASLACFPEVAIEIALNALIGFADGYSGEDLPRLIMRPPHELEGEVVPGNRGLHDNPDTCYRLVPLDGRSDFILDGRLGPAPATIFELSVLTSQWQTIAHLTKADLGLVPGRHFRIHVGRQPGPEVDCFLQTSEDAEMLLVRETLADWSSELPCRLSIESRARRGGPRPHDDPAFVESAARRVEKWFDQSIRLTRETLSRPANDFPAPVIRNEHGKLVTMAYSIGHFRIRAGEALILTLDPGSAQYVVAPITNLWGTTGRDLASGASWNSKQAALNDDGSFTCVLALDDPGVYNWLDPAGLERGFLFLRWAGLDPVEAPERAPALMTRVVPIAALPDTLPRETRWVDAEERCAVRETRVRNHARRYEELGHG